MLVYPQTTDHHSVCWPDPIETGWQLLGGSSPSALAPKLPHLGLADILFITMVMDMPRTERHWGIVTWMSTVFMVSRPSLYALAERVKQRLTAPLPQQQLVAEQRATPVYVTPTRLARTVLTASLPGKTAIRPLQPILQEAFGQTRSIGWISELLTAAGHKARTVLEKVDTTPLGVICGARDETFFHGQPLLLVIDPVTTTILFAEVCADRQAETWGAALLIAQERGVQIGGLVEDMARMYAKSQTEAELEVAVQKDVWHVERDGAQVLTALERAAFRATKKVVQLEKKLRKHWDEACFDTQYIEAVAREEQLYTQHAAFAEALSHFVDALELVDWRSGEIRERPVSDWLLEETVLLMEAIDHPRVLKWVKTLRRHQSQLLTALDWLAVSLQSIGDQVTAHLPCESHTPFLRLVARHWRLQQALINGHTHFHAEAQTAAYTLQQFLGENPACQSLVDNLLDCLNAACRTSSMIENINGLLKQFLHTHKAFRSPETLQLYLNLFVLWHNTRIFERGKRAGKSPYQLAGITTPSDDWLSLLGYPAE